MIIMSIAYVILTCEKYLNTRVVWQKNTCFPNANINVNLYYLAHKMDLDQGLYWWGSPDSYECLPYKLRDFFQNMNLQEDWIVIIDDDTFVFHDHLVDLLSFYSPSQPISIGCILKHVNTEWGLYHSGGAGTVLSQITYQRIRQLNKRLIHWCADICMGVWLKETDCYKIHHDGFNTECNTECNTNTITLHHLKVYEDYKKLKRSIT